MARFNKEERSAIINKINKIVEQKKNDHKKLLFDNFKDDVLVEYEAAINQYNDALSKLKNIHESKFSSWQYCELKPEKLIKEYKEELINPQLLRKYRIDKDEINDDLILAGKDCDLEELINNLVEKYINNN